MLCIALSCWATLAGALVLCRAAVGPCPASPTGALTVYGVTAIAVLWLVPQTVIGCGLLAGPYVWGSRIAPQHACMHAWLLP